MEGQDEGGIYIKQNLLMQKPLVMAKSKELTKGKTTLSVSTSPVSDFMAMKVTGKIKMTLVRVR